MIFKNAFRGRERRKSDLIDSLLESLSFENPVIMGFIAFSREK